MDNPYIVKSEQTKYRNRWIHVREFSVVMPNGGDGIFGTIDMKNGVSVVALDNNSNIILVEEYKFAIGRSSIELISGGMDGDESPMVAGKRELLEEVGGVSDDWVDLGCLDPFSSLVNSKNYMLLARNVIVPEKHVPPADEPLRSFRIPFIDALDMVMDSKITHGASCVAILKASKLI